MTELVFRDDAYTQSCTARVVAADERGIRLDRTVFYPTGGGQPGDSGTLRLASGASVAIVDTLKGELPNEVIHVPAPGAVTGGQVSDGRGRLDFDVPGASLDKEAIAAQLNAMIAAAHEVTPRWITDEELQARPELVRTMSVKPPVGAGRVRLMEIAGLDAPIDLQPCGGTHIRNTAEIGPVVIGKIENKGRQNRRINIAFSE